jgi:hypothetical protein
MVFLLVILVAGTLLFMVGNAKNGMNFMLNLAYEKSTRTRWGKGFGGRWEGGREEGEKGMVNNEKRGDREMKNVSE